MSNAIRSKVVSSTRAAQLASSSAGASGSTPGVDLFVQLWSTFGNDPQQRHVPFRTAVGTSYLTVWLTVPEAYRLLGVYATLTGEEKRAILEGIPGDFSQQLLLETLVSNRPLTDNEVLDLARRFGV
jgi:hypothetical protein